MSRPVKLNEEEISKILEEIREKLTKMNIPDGKLEFSKSFSSNKKNAILYFSPIAWTKMTTLVMGFDTEVGWLGTTSRVEMEDPEDTAFLVEDILVCPQQVNETRVTTDKVGYGEWLKTLDDDTFKNLRFDGHSHVNLGASPSGTDLGNQREILKQIHDDMFQIFLIMNKKLEFNIKIYDLKTNTLYETGDVDVQIWFEEEDLDVDYYLSETKKLVKPMTYTYASGNAWNGNSAGKSSGKSSGKSYSKNEDRFPVLKSPQASASKNGYDYSDCYGVDEYDWRDPFFCK